MKIGIFFLSLTLKNARTLGKLAKFFLVVREPRKDLGKMTKKVIRNSEMFPRKFRSFGWSSNRDKICIVVRESEKVENRWPIVIRGCIESQKWVYGLARTYAS